MKTEANDTLAARRAALIGRCAQQRAAMAGEIRALAPPGGGLGGNWKLTVAGMLLAFVASRSGRVMPLIATALSVWKVVGGVLGSFRRR